jgi:hypothetical protein
MQDRSPFARGIPRPASYESDLERMKNRTYPGLAAAMSQADMQWRTVALDNCDRHCCLLRKERQNVATSPSMILYQPNSQRREAE